jgi:hypothetical protein
MENLYKVISLKQKMEILMITIGAYFLHARKAFGSNLRTQVTLRK